MAEGTDFKDRILSVLDPNARRGATQPLLAMLIIIFSVVFIAACVVLAFFYFLDIERFFKWWAKKDAEMQRKFDEARRKRRK